MEVIPIKTGVLNPGEEVINLFLKYNKNKISSGDILVIASKIVSFEQNRIINLKKVKSTQKARLLSKKYKLSPAFCQLVIEESDRIFGGVKKAILTQKEGYVLANAGIDHSNVKSGYAALWPIDRSFYLEELKKRLEGHFQAKIGLIMADSHCAPLRLGTRAMAIAIAGFKGISDERGFKDLFFNKMKITQQSLADDLASAANILMGESRQRIPFVLIKKAPVKLSQKPARILTQELLIKPNSCLFRNYCLK